MILNIALGIFIVFLTIILLFTAKKYTKNFVGRKGFCLKVFLTMMAIVIPQAILQDICVFLPLNKITYMTMATTSFIILILFFIFLFYLFFWKLKNRNFMLAISCVTAVILYLHSIFVLYCVPFSLEKSINKEYGKTVENIEIIKTKSGLYPENIDINTSEFEHPNYYYRNFDKGNNFVLYIGVGQSLWSYCSDKNSENCFPDKWLFLKDGTNQWIEIPESEKYRVKIDNISKEIKNFTAWTLLPREN